MLYADSKNRVSNDYPKGKVWPVSNPKSIFSQLSSLNSKWLRSLRLIFFVDGHLNRRLKTTKFTRQDSVDKTCKVCKWTNWQAERCNAKKSSVLLSGMGSVIPNHMISLTRSKKVMNHLDSSIVSNGHCCTCCLIVPLRGTLGWVGWAPLGLMRIPHVRQKSRQESGTTKFKGYHLDKHINANAVCKLEIHIYRIFVLVSSWLLGRTLQ